jgi:hypothetical protein
MMRLRCASTTGTLAVGGLVLLIGAGCDKSSEGTQAPSAPASQTSAAVPPPAETAQATNQDPGNAGNAGDEYEDNDPSALTDFHQTLDPHGSWSEDPKYGTVWVPNAGVVGEGFVPYQTGGHWAYADDDYIWVSDYAWGWAPFHYGRWAHLGTGWGWIPGRTYAPAWVNWRVGAPGFGFVGWGPMAPTWGWRGGVVANFGFGIEPRWSYCATGDLFNRGLAGHVLSGPRVGQAEAGTKPWTEGSGGRGGHSSGPPPGKIGIPNDKVVHPAANDPGISKAQSFGKPSSAVAQGGHPPAHSGGPTLGSKAHPDEPPSSLHGGGNESPHGNEGPRDPKAPSPANTFRPPSEPHGNPGGGEPHGNPGGGKPSGPPPGGGKHEH